MKLPVDFLFQFNLLLFSVSLAWMIATMFGGYPNFGYRCVVLEHGLKILLFEKILKKKVENKYSIDIYLASIIIFLLLFLFLFISSIFILEIYQHLYYSSKSALLHHMTTLLITPFFFVIIPIFYQAFLWHLLTGCCPDDFKSLTEKYWIRRIYGEEQVKEWKEKLKNEKEFKKTQYKYAFYKLLEQAFTFQKGFFCLQRRSRLI